MNLQEVIHYIEVGAGKRYLRFLLPCVVILGLAILYDFRCWKNFSAPEAMDSSQLARNIAAGKGYTTLFIRPLSIYLVQEENEAKKGANPSAPGETPDFARLNTAHPDLANPPVYPFVLAGLMKIVPFQYPINSKSVFWADNGSFRRYQPDFVVTIFNELLFLAAVAMTFFIARKLFDTGIARLAAVLMLGCEILWHFSASGLSTMLLLLIFLILFRCMMAIEEMAREAEPDWMKILGWSVGVGILMGVGALTRYAFGWLIIPVAVFLISFSGPKKILNAVAAFAVFAITLAPWIARNISISGTPFGTAGYAVFEGTALSGGFPLDRSLHPNLLEAFLPIIYWRKFIMNVQPILTDDLIKIGGIWLSVLFFAGLLLAFNRPAARRMRYFLLMCLATFIVIQPLSRTSLSDISPEINSENLLALTAPLVIIFGTAFFFILLDQMKFAAVELRYVAIGIFIAVCCLPLFFALWFKTSPVSYPPYYPPDIQKAAGWMKDNELVMSDVPWAVAWYGQRQSVWLTDDDQDSFFALNDYVKSVSALYLTTRTMDSKLLTDCFRSGKNSWGSFVLQALAKEQIPTTFPLRRAPSGSAALESGLFLTDAERWKIGTSPAQ